MSNLQIGLAVVGGIVLAAVVAHGAWVTRKNLPRQADADVGIEADASGAPPHEIDRIEPALAVDPFHIPPPEKKPVLDALIDVIAPLNLDAPVSGDAALLAAPLTRRVGSKPFAIEGLNAASQRWEAPLPGQRYDALQVGMQLANRSGALNDIEFSEFVIKVQAYADALGANPEFPEMREEVARARELDAFAGEHDAQLGFTLRAVHSAWSPGYVAQHAARCGFVPGAFAGRLVLPSSMPGMPPVLVLGFEPLAAMAEDPAQSAIREITLSLDVPQVDRSERPFVQMRETAAALALAMEALVTDDNGAALSTDSMDRIGSELETLYDTLDSRDLSAGSALARRLFS